MGTQVLREDGGPLLQESERDVARERAEALEAAGGAAIDGQGLRARIAKSQRGKDQ